MKKIHLIIPVIIVSIMFLGCFGDGSSSVFSKTTSLSNMELNESNVSTLCKKIVKEFNKNETFVAELTEVEVKQDDGPYVEAKFLIKVGLNEEIYKIYFYPESENSSQFDWAFIGGYRGDITDTRIEEHQLLVSAFEIVVFGKTEYKSAMDTLIQKVSDDVFAINEDCEISYSISDEQNIIYDVEIQTNHICEFFDYKITL